jgi:hypothetical protein
VLFRSWIRDNAGPLRAFVTLGAIDDAAAMLDYLHAAAVIEGDLSNSYAADLDTSELPETPDWGALPPLSGKTAAENISHIALMYHWYAKASGDLDRVADHFGYITRSVVAQSISEEGFLPFSGDETFRTAMNIAFGLPLEVAHHELSWSLNSALLFLGASEALFALAADVDATYPEEALSEKVALVRGTLEDVYLQPEGYLAAYIDKATMEPSVGPFDDANLAAMWSGAFFRDDALAMNDCASLLAHAHPAPGVIQSPPDEQYVGFMGLPIEQGVRTGMVSGYTLYTLSHLGHTEAQAAFDHLGREAMASAEFGEYLVLDDASVLQSQEEPIFWSCRVMIP